MLEAKSMSVRHSIRLAVALTLVSTLLGSTAFFTYQVYQVRRDSEHLRLRIMAEIYATQMAPTLLAHQMEEVEREIADSPKHPGVCLLAVLDQRGRVITVRGHETLLLDYLAKHTERPDEPSQYVVANFPGDSSSGEPDLVLAEVPIVPSGADVAIGSFVCAARKIGATGVSAQGIWMFYIGTLGAASAGMVLGLFWLNKKVLSPLRELTRTRRASDLAKKLPTHRDDEIGELARMLEEMHHELADWRNKNEELERSVNHRVVSETKSITLELTRAKKEIWTDPLTKLSNRRLYDERFAGVFNEQKKAGRELSLVMLDVDHFKALNDTLGHRAGDKVLIFIGELLKQCLREEDLAIRYGGDEFLLVFPDVAPEDARAIAERACKMFAQQMKLYPVDQPPTMSGGVAALCHHQVESSHELFELADQALYRAKHGGKDQVVIAGQRSPAELSTR